MSDTVSTVADKEGVCDVAEEIRAELVASVLQVVAVEGASLTEGDTVFLLESMKMEIPVVVEVAGRLTRILVAVGDVVREGDLLALVD